ncbi:hypothetical protein AVEN_105104-1 [Araneus ventricosus]|uniref:Uncharacterized protein n=1 Tax=Araneus ventricosus TaxID=182803 RepID=A0A4Y2RLS2_ARAVE|nr:hypothetical protein AVEN_105104-1 [Araneus ventricosus]
MSSLTLHCIGSGGLVVHCTHVASHNPTSKSPGPVRRYVRRSWWPCHDSTPAYPPLWECCIQKLTNNVAVVWWSAVLLRGDTFWKLWNCRQLHHVNLDV